MSPSSPNGGLDVDTAAAAQEAVLVSETGFRTNPNPNPDPCIRIQVQVAAAQFRGHEKLRCACIALALKVTFRTPPDISEPMAKPQRLPLAQVILRTRTFSVGIAKFMPVRNEEIISTTCRFGMQDYMYTKTVCIYLCVRP